MTPEYITPDHLRLLALARAAMIAADDRGNWRRDLMTACETHGAACDALWDELERQVTIADGGVPVLEHPTARSRRLAQRMRTEIISACQDAVSGALDNLISGRLHDTEDDD